MAKRDRTEYLRKWRAANPERVREYGRRDYASYRGRLARRRQTLLRLYGMSLFDFQRLLERQKYRCTLCDRPFGGRQVHVDHNHVTGKVRGLLHSQCNAMLGWGEGRKFQDYLEKYDAIVC